MGEVITRKCAKCKNVITIEHNNISDVIYHNKLYYHEKCFCDLCTQRVEKKRGKWEEWQEALDNIWQLEADTNEMLEHYFVKEELNEWLLKNYDICVVPTYFWQLVADLEHGVYKGKRCKPISIETLFGAWKWGQKKLDEINRNNKIKHIGPANDCARINYDLAIIVSKIPNYLAYKAKSKTNATELMKNTLCNEVDISKIGQQKQESKNNISDIFNDLYVE